MNKEAVSGATAGFMATITLHPLDVIKTRLQVQDLQIATKYNGTLHAFKTILKNEGARGLYAGLSPAVVGNTASWAMYFAFYDRARKRYEKASNDDGEVEKKKTKEKETKCESTTTKTRFAAAWWCNDATNKSTVSRVTFFPLFWGNSLFITPFIIHTHTLLLTDIRRTDTYLK